MLDLPADIIEKIILSSDMIISTYNTIITLVKTLLSNYDKITQHKTINSKYEHYLSIYLFLSNNITKLNIYKQSGWYNYFIDNKNFITNNQIDNINKSILHNLNLIKPIINYDNDEKYNDYNDYINYIELHINRKQLKLLIQEILAYWNINIKDLGSFSILIIVLLSSTTFNTNINMNNLYIENHLYMKFIKEKEEISSNMNMNITIPSPIPIHIPCYINPNNNMIPLFQNYIGMGYTYNIGWDILIKKYIGFLFGGSSAEDFEYIDNTLQIYLLKNKTERLDYIKKYKKIININKLIEVLLLENDKTISYYEQICIN